MEILNKLNINTKNEEIYVEAFTHSSYGYEHNIPNYERLEFLGDKILDFYVSDYLYRKNTLAEGKMTTLRSNYVCEEALYTYATSLGFEEYILVASGLVNRITKSIIADVFEAFIGALYIDKGLDETLLFIKNNVIPHLEKEEHFLQDYKTVLQNYVQTIQGVITYEIVGETGPAHEKEFTCVIKIDEIILGTGVASTKKQAEQEAAKEALSKVPKG